MRNDYISPDFEIVTITLKDVILSSPATPEIPKESGIIVDPDEELLE